MRFSYSLIKKLAPAVKSKNDLIEKLNLYSFEAEDSGGDTVDISVPPNRYSDAASHLGIAREISAILGKNPKISRSKRDALAFGGKVQNFKVEVKDRKLCPRYIGQYFENIKIKSSPKWMQDILKSCGLKPINNVVDIMNYVMLETGQPLHAFNYDKIDGKNIVVRRAKNNEKIITLDNEEFKLDSNILVIADFRKPLAIAGIKGGKKAEVGSKTKRIIVEAASFDAVNIYKSSKELGLITDASARFSHNISSELAAIGINRAAELLKEIVSAKSGKIVDTHSKKHSRRVIKFDIEKFNNFIGVKSNQKEIGNYLKRLGFSIISKSKFLIEIPSIRLDIETFEDLAEEVIRLYGYNKLKSSPPRIHITPSGFEDELILKDKIRKVLVGFGLDEVYNYSFISRTNADYTQTDTESLYKSVSSQYGSVLVELENPISSQFKYLRPSLFINLLKNIKDNFRFFDDIKIFEIGKVFSRRDANVSEKLNLGIAVASKNKETFFEIKGITEELFKRIGLVDYFMPGKKGILLIKSNGKKIGELKKAEAGKFSVALAEIDLEELLKLIEGEREYLPLSKHPSIMRDISVLVSRKARIGDMIRIIQISDFKNIRDVDLIDEYDFPDKRSFTFRIIFQAKDRTLTDDEVDKEMKKITSILQSKFNAEIR